MAGAWRRLNKGNEIFFRNIVLRALEGEDGITTGVLLVVASELLGAQDEVSRG